MTFDILITPITGVISGSVLLGNLFYLKGKEISIVRLVIWIIWIMLLFAILGFVAVKIDNLPLRFFLITAFSLIYGSLYMILAPITMQWWQRSAPVDILLTGFIFLFFGIAVFSFIYSVMLKSEISVNYFLAGILSFLLPQLLMISYDYWMSIPAKKYRTWSYPLHQTIPILQPVDPIRLVMNFTPVPAGKNGPFEGYEVEFPTNISLSELFHYFISFHNKHREYRKKPIQFMDGDKPLEWILFKYSGQKKKVFLDMDKTLLENSIDSNEAIYAMSLN